MNCYLYLVSSSTSRLTKARKLVHFIEQKFFLFFSPRLYKFRKSFTHCISISVAILMKDSLLYYSFHPDLQIYCAKTN